MAVWESFIDLVHLIGALGCLLLTGGFAAAGEPGRAVFYAAATVAFALGCAHRRHVRSSTVPRPAAPVLLDLRPTAAPTAGTAARTR